MVEREKIIKCEIIKIRRNYAIIDIKANKGAINVELFGENEPYVEGDPVSRRCSRCGYRNVPMIRLNAYGRWMQIPYNDLICPECSQHPSVTPS